MKENKKLIRYYLKKAKGVSLSSVALFRKDCKYLNNHLKSDYIIYGMEVKEKQKL